MAKSCSIFNLVPTVWLDLLTLIQHLSFHLTQSPLRWTQRNLHHNICQRAAVPVIPLGHEAARAHFAATQRQRVSLASALHTNCDRNSGRPCHVSKDDSCLSRKINKREEDGKTLRVLAVFLHDFFGWNSRIWLTRGDIRSQVFGLFARRCAEEEGWRGLGRMTGDGGGELGAPGRYVLFVWIKKGKCWFYGL